MAGLLRGSPASPFEVEEMFGVGAVGGGRFLAQGCYSPVAGSAISMSPVLTS
jgi:hypothetical protein